MVDKSSRRTCGTDRLGKDMPRVSAGGDGVDVLRIYGNLVMVGYGVHVHVARRYSDKHTALFGDLFGGAGDIVRISAVTLGIGLEIDNYLREFLRHILLLLSCSLYLLHI